MSRLHRGPIPNTYYSLARARGIQCFGRCTISEQANHILLSPTTGSQDTIISPRQPNPALNPTDAELDLATLDSAMERYFSAGLAESTARVYASGINRYLSMCRKLYTPPTPTSEELLCKFVTYLAMNNIASNTIKVYLSGVRQLHIRQGIPPPPPTAEMARLTQVLRGIKMTQAAERRGAARQRLPITPDMLRQIKVRWQLEPPSKDRIMLWAAFLTCFFGFFRSGEICAKQSGAFDPSTDLSMDCVKVDNLLNPRVIQIRLAKSKTDQGREGAIINLPRTEDDLCPVAALLTWLVYRGNFPGPLFLFQSGAHLTRARLVEELRKAMERTGLEPNQFSGHSFRIGAATAAAARGIPDSQIKLLGRWKSAAFQLYLKPSGTQMAQLASRLSQVPALLEHGQDHSAVERTQRFASGRSEQDASLS